MHLNSFVCESLMSFLCPRILRSEAYCFCPVCLSDVNINGCFNFSVALQVEDQEGNLTKYILAKVCTLNMCG